MAQPASTRPDHDDRPVAETTERTETDLDLDDIYHILQTRRRRDVLRYLRRADEPITLRELAERIAAWEHETTVENLNSSQRQRVYISLYQSHLPKLDTFGVVSYDKDRGTVESTDRLSQFEPYLTGLDESTFDDPWPRRYGAAVGGCGGFLTAIASGVVPVSWPVGAVVIVITFGLLSGTHAYSRSEYALLDGQ